MLNLSYLMSVGELRYIQSRYERPEFRNPDTVVSEFLSIPRRLSCSLRGRFLLPVLRSKPFYYYLLCRTIYYDEVFLDAIWDSVKFIINIGCGTDTRPYRFAHLLKQKGVRVLECDQPAAIARKQQIAAHHWPIDHVTYLAIDLNDESWPEFERQLRQNRQNRVMVMMEGVSPYVSQTGFESFLRLLGQMLIPGSLLAYDFKIEGVDSEFGGSEKTARPFRLPADRQDVTAFHRTKGFRLDQMEPSSELSERLLPSLASTGQRLFREDCLLRLTASPE